VFERQILLEWLLTVIIIIDIGEFWTQE